MRPYGLVGRRIGQDRLAKTTSPYIIYRGCACVYVYVYACADSTSTENERNHQPNLLLYILFIYGLMGYNL